MGCQEDAYTIGDANMDNEMDKVCANCGERYGDHCGTNCPYQDSTFVEKTVSGCPNDNPNALFKNRKKYNELC